MGLSSEMHDSGIFINRCHSNARTCQSISENTKNRIHLGFENMKREREKIRHRNECVHECMNERIYANECEGELIQVHCICLIIIIIITMMTIIVGKVLVIKFIPLCLNFHYVYLRFDTYTSYTHTHTCRLCCWHKGGW